ncbi:MAG: hypothetical protein QNJ32_18205 [Xenococcaceae cyanobacterium MO_167.B27]|nr:hypothetical protein [Xenococcaceae cyanobacterium MO_167.B27]
MVSYCSQGSVKSGSPLSLVDICFTARVGRSHFKHRLAIVTVSIPDLQAKLSSFLQGNTESGVFSGKISPKHTVAPAFNAATLPTEEITGNNLAKLYVKGANIAWKELYQEYSGKKVPLPNYPFQRKIYWLNKDC